MKQKGVSMTTEGVVFFSYVYDSKPSEREQQIIREYKSLKNSTEVGKKLGITRARVCNVLKKAGIPVFGNKYYYKNLKEG